MVISLTRTEDNSVIHQGNYHSLRHCIESAISDGKDLSGISLRNARLVNASMDGAKMRGADFTGANLTGTNLSEADMAGSIFNGASLHNACLCWSNLSSCSFRFTNFGATDMTGAVLNASVFAGLSTFLLSFREMTSMQNCSYEELDGRSLNMSSPPLVILGLERQLAVLDECILCGNRKMQLPGTDRPAGPAFENDGENDGFAGRHMDLIAQLIRNKSKYGQPEVVGKSIDRRTGK